MIQAECVVQNSDTLGEVPIWSVRDHCLYWIDVRKPALQAYDPSTGSIKQHPMPELIGSYCERQAGGMLLALKSGLYLYDPNTQELQPCLNIEPGLPNNRLNDGKCDRQGRFWVGSMNDGDRLPSGTLYRVDRDRESTPFITGITIPNSLAFSPDGKRMYFADTPTRKIMVYDFDTDTGIPHNGRVFRDMSSHPGRPDGATVDADGCLWSAEVHGSRVVHYTPDGEINQVVELPVTGITSCGFGGDDLDTLYITTATQGLSDEQRAQQPLAGALFAAHVGTKGVAEPMFRG